MQLLRHQSEFVRRVYDEGSLVRLGVQSGPRGIGKTGFASALVLAHLLGPESEARGAIFSAAIDRQQSALVFNEVVAIIEAVPEFAERCNIQRFRKVIEVMDGPGKGSTFEALSSDVRRGHGLAPSLFIADEFGVWKSGELLDTLTTGMGKRTRSLGLVISTQAGSDQHPLSLLIDDGLRGLDPSIYVQLISAPVESDPFAESTWRACNPSLDVFLDAETIRSEAARAQRVPTFENTFRNLRLNQRVATETRWISEDAWRACADPTFDLEALVGQPCVGGLDLGSTRDLTAFALFWPQTGALATWSWCPTETLTAREQSDRAPYRAWSTSGYIELTPGSACDKRTIALRLGELYATFKPSLIAFDRWQIAELERVLRDEGLDHLPLKEHGQGFRDMAPSTAAFEMAVLNGQLRHDGNPLLSWSLSNVALESDATGAAKPHKRRSRDRIDPVVASIMAVGMAAREPAPAPEPRIWGIFESDQGFIEPVALGR